MKLHSRGDSAALQSRIPVSNTSGERSHLWRSLRTSDAGEAAVRAGSLAALASGIHNPDFLTVRRLVEDVFKASGLSVPVILEHALPERVMLSEFGASYIKRREGRVSVSHLALLRRAVTSFCRANKGLEVGAIAGHHVQTWVDRLLDHLAFGTVFNWFNAVSGLLQHAVGLGHLRVNPCPNIDLRPGAGGRGVVHREPMPDADFEKLLEGARGSEWETAALLGRFAGLRIADAVQVAGEHLSFADGACLLAVKPGKTERCEVLPLFGRVVGHLRGIWAPGLLTPTLAGLSVDRLSKAFCALCDGAGVDSKSVSLGNGRTARRVSFHSLRHSFVTDLARRGIPQELRKKLSAHVSDSAHEVYDHASALDLHRQLQAFFSPP